MESPDWNSDFVDLIDCLTAEGAQFVVVGAFALAQHGLPRATGDLDVFVQPSPENAPRVFRALRRFGAPLDSSNVAVTDFAQPGVVYQLGVVPRRIDVLTDISGISFDEAWATKVNRSIAGRQIPFLGREALLRNKRESGRPKDLVDVASLERLKRS